MATHTIGAIFIASSLVTDDPNFDAWDSVDYHRAMVREHGAGLVDLDGREVVDAVPTGHALDVDSGIAWERDAFDVDAFVSAALADAVWS